MKRRCFALLLLCLVGLSIVIAATFGLGLGPFYRNPSEAMSQREVTRCFRRNVDFLVIVADYLEAVSYNTHFEVQNKDGVPVLYVHRDSNRVEIEDERVVNAIMHLWEQGYGEIRSSHSHNSGGNVTFVRSMRRMVRNERLPDESPWNIFWGHYGGLFQTGVAYLFDNRYAGWYIPLSRPNWYFFARLGD